MNFPVLSLDQQNCMRKFNCLIKKVCICFLLVSVFLRLTCLSLWPFLVDFVENICCCLISFISLLICFEIVTIHLLVYLHDNIMLKYVIQCFIWERKEFILCYVKRGNANEEFGIILIAAHFHIDIGLTLSVCLTSMYNVVGMSYHNTFSCTLFHLT